MEAQGSCPDPRSSLRGAGAHEGGTCLTHRLGFSHYGQSLLSAHRPGNPTTIPSSYPRAAVSVPGKQEEHGGLFPAWEREAEVRGRVPAPGQAM